MVQEEIIKILEEKEFLTGTEIINELRQGDGASESIRKRLKQLRKFKEIGFIEVNKYNVEESIKMLPLLSSKIDEMFSCGFKIRRPMYIYFSLKLYPNGKKIK